MWQAQQDARSSSTLPQQVPEPAFKEAGPGNMAHMHSVLHEYIKITFFYLHNNLHKRQMSGSHLKLKYVCFWAA